jgi:hypothetical protein
MLDEVCCMCELSQSLIFLDGDAEPLDIINLAPPALRLFV